MKRFNIALLPIDPDINTRFVTAAQTFAPHADRYLLGKDALPHVTLCQFLALDEEYARNAFAHWTGQKHFSVTLANFRVKPGVNEHQGTWWPEIETVRDDALMALQGSLHAYLSTCGLRALTDIDTYRPHFTLARCSGRVPDQNNPPDLPAGLHIPCAAALGDCSDTGVFIRPLMAFAP